MNRLLPTIFSVVVVLTLATSVSGQTPPEKLRSPKGNYALQVLHKPLAGADQAIDFFTLVLSRNGKPIAMLPTSGYLLSAHWSADGKFVAVNNRRGNAGDYLWVFQLPEGKVVKRPDDGIGEIWRKKAMQEVEKTFAGANENSLIRCWIASAGWQGNQLQVTVRGSYRIEGAVDFEISVDPANWSIISSKLSKTN